MKRLKEKDIELFKYCYDLGAQTYLFYYLQVCQKLFMFKLAYLSFQQVMVLRKRFLKPTKHLTNCTQNQKLHCHLSNQLKSISRITPDQNPFYSPILKRTYIAFFVPDCLYSTSSSLLFVSSPRSLNIYQQTNHTQNTI